MAYSVSYFSEIFILPFCIKIHVNIFGNSFIGIYFMYESFTYLKGTVSVVCAEQGPEEMAHCLQHTQQEFGFIVTEDTKCVAFP